MSRLRDQQSIERIAMVMRQIAHRGSMYGEPVTRESRLR